jgi:hypothetical protein
MKSTYRREVLGLATVTVVSTRVPPRVVLELGASNTSSRRRELEFPRSVVLKVGDLTVPLPILSYPLATDTSAITGKNNIAVEIITPQASGRTGIAHVNGETVNLSILETVTGQKVITGSSRAVFQKALGTNVDTVRNNVLGPDVVVTVRAGLVDANSVLVLTSLESGRIACKITVVSYWTKRKTKESVSLP